MIKIIVLYFVLFNLSFAYKVNDKLDDSVVEKLELKRDKVYVLNFFASWCVSCKKELPLLSKLKLPSNSQLIGINIDEEISDGKDFVMDLNLNFKIVYDTDNKIVSKFSPIGVPAIYYVKNLTVKKRIFGAINHIDEIVTKDLKKLGK